MTSGRYYERGFQFEAFALFLLNLSVLSSLDAIFSCLLAATVALFASSVLLLLAPTRVSVVSVHCMLKFHWMGTHARHFSMSKIDLMIFKSFLID